MRVHLSILSDVLSKCVLYFYTFQYQMERKKVEYRREIVKTKVLCVDVHLFFLFSTCSFFFVARSTHIPSFCVDGI